LRLLLDTHALIWWLADPSRLTSTGRDAIAHEDNEILVSAASAMEVTTKYRLGKLDGGERLALHFFRELRAEGFAELAISVEHASFAGSLAIPHKDPFDRLLIAQATIEAVPLVSNEKLFDIFGIERLW
jgi:PIN domain nuclease of toxin-antitoxin system